MKMQPLQPSDLETLLADFGDISRIVSEGTDRDRIREDVANWYKKNPDGSEAYAKALFDSTPVGGGLVWYSDVVEDINMSLIGRPKDYILIRDDFDALKKFLFKTLDRGRLNFGDDNWDHTRGTTTADYVTWMYLNSQHQPFKRNTERAIVELLKDELRRKFTPLKSADEWHVKLFGQQFNRLAGLLDVVSFVGNPDNGFVEAYEGLAQKAKEGFMRNAPPLYYADYYEVNVYSSILQALGRIQKNDGLRDLWLQNIRNDNQPKRVVESIRGLFRAYKTKKERHEQIPAVLAKLQERGHGLDQTRQHTKTLLFKEDAHLLDGIVYNLVSLPYGFGRFGHFYKDAASLDVLSKERIEDGEYHFTFTRYTPAGRQVLKTTYDLRTDTLQGDAQLENTVRAYFEGGYKIGYEIKVTSLEGRKITGNEAKIVEVGEQNVDGLYEGLVGLNGTPFPFLFNPANGAVLLAEQLDQNVAGFFEKSWKKGRVGLEKVTAKVPYDKFLSVSQFAQRVDELSQEIRKEDSLLWDVYNGLSGRLSDKVASALGLVISSRLVKAGDGLL